MNCFFIHSRFFPDDWSIAVIIIFAFAVWTAKTAESAAVKYWKIIADNLSKAGWSWGCVSALDAEGRTIWIADAHRDDGKRFTVRADEILTAFLELKAAIRAGSVFSSVVAPCARFTIRVRVRSP
jgi:hypothetical protein